MSGAWTFTIFTRFLGPCFFVFSWLRLFVLGSFVGFRVFFDSVELAFLVGGGDGGRFAGPAALDLDEAAFECPDETGVDGVFLVEVLESGGFVEGIVGGDDVFDGAVFLDDGLDAGAGFENFAVEHGVDGETGAAVGPLEVGDFADDGVFVVVERLVFGDVGVEELVEFAAVLVAQQGGVRRYEEFESGGAFAVGDGVAFGLLFSGCGLRAFGLRAILAGDLG